MRNVGAIHTFIRKACSDHPHGGHTGHKVVAPQHQAYALSLVQVAARIA